MQYTFLLVLTLLNGSIHAQTFFEKADLFFSEHVSNGMVDYAAIKKDPSELNELVKEIADLDLSNRRVTPEFLKAFYINSYNILVIEQVVDRYPLESPMDVDGFFDGIKHEVMGSEMTLDELEKETLCSQFPDPRLHFVLVCAAKGCPPLAPYSYQPEKLEKQLTERTSEVMNLDWFIRVKGNKAEISRIFDWYKNDFVKSSGSVISYINQYRDKKIDKDKDISYYEYDWSLNER